MNNVNSMKFEKSPTTIHFRVFLGLRRVSLLRIEKTSTMADAAKAAAQQRKDSEKEGGKKAQDIAGEK